MIRKIAVTEIDEYHDDKSYYLWAFFQTAVNEIYKGCPLGREAEPSMFSDIHPLEDVFNPTTFMNTCKQDWDIPRIIHIPKHMKYELTDDKWLVCEVVGDFLKYSPEVFEIMDEAMKRNYSHVLAIGKTVHEDYWLNGKPKDLEEDRKRRIENEMYDDYFYDYKMDGGLWCSGYSMHEDNDSCEAYQETHPEYCKNCRSRFRV